MAPRLPVHRACRRAPPHLFAPAPEPGRTLVGLPIIRLGWPASSSAARFQPPGWWRWSAGSCSRQGMRSGGRSRRHSFADRGDHSNPMSAPSVGAVAMAIRSGRSPPWAALLRYRYGSDQRCQHPDCRTDRNRLGVGNASHLDSRVVDARRGTERPPTRMPITLGSERDVQEQHHCKHPRIFSTPGSDDGSDDRKLPRPTRMTRRIVPLFSPSTRSHLVPLIEAVLAALLTRST